MSLITQEDQIVISETDVFQIILNLVSGDKEQDEPFYVYQIQDVIHKYENWRDKIPRVTPFYAVKCNDHPFLLNTLNALGTGFDCATKDEIRKILALGVHPARIVYAHPTKLPSHINYAKENNVDLITFDNEEELYKFKSLYPAARLVLRIRCDAKKVQYLLGNKFGCDSNSEAPKLIHLARILGLKIVGISFHVGSGCNEPLAYRRGISTAHTLFKLGDELGFNMELLDIGGGFNGVKESSLDEVAHIINTALDEFFPPSRGVRIISEPGTYFAQSAFTLSTCIHSKKTIKHPDKPKSKYNIYYINDSIFKSFDVCLYTPEAVKPIILKKPTSDEKIPSKIWGSTISNRDWIIENFDLPDLNIGDWLLFENMGAYSFVLTRRFLGSPPRVYALVNTSNRKLLGNLISNGDFLTVDQREAIIEEKKSLSEKWKNGIICPSLSVRLSQFYKKACMWRLNRWNLT